MSQVQPICKGNSATLTASGCPGTVTWNNGGGTGSSISVSPTITTTYIASCNNPNICVGNNSATVTVYSAVIATPHTTKLCVTNPIVLTATGSQFYQWQKDNADIQGANESNYSATQLGTYKTYAIQSLWTTQNSGVITKLNSVFFVDKLKGWAAGDGGVILASIDGGTTWTPQSSGVIENLYGIAFINATTGIAVGNSGTVVRTTNGGSTWTIIPRPTTANLRRIAFGDDNTVMVGGYGDGSRIIKTTDAGLTWSFTYTNSFNSTGVYAIDMLNSTNALVVMNGGATVYNSP